MLEAVGTGTQQFLLDMHQLASFLGASTSDLEFLHEIPRNLVKILPLDRAAFTVAGIDPAMTAPLISGCVAEPGKEPRELSVLELKNTDLAHADDRTILLTRTIGNTVQMQLQLRWAPNLSLNISATTDTVCDILSRMLYVLCSWRTQPNLLGANFGKLSDAQWRALLSMSSDASEKQLAEQLMISHHTLHSHIKVIYLKLGVRSRLEAVRRLQRAVRGYSVSAQQRLMSDRGETAAGGTRAPDIKVMSKNILAARESLAGRVAV